VSAPVAPGPGQPHDPAALGLLLSCIPMSVCSANAAGPSHYFYVVVSKPQLYVSRIRMRAHGPNRGLPLRARALLVFLGMQERPCSWRMSTELGDSIVWGRVTGWAGCC